MLKDFNKSINKIIMDIWEKVNKQGINFILICGLAVFFGYREHVGVKIHDSYVKSTDDRIQALTIKVDKCNDEKYQLLLNYGWRSTEAIEKNNELLSQIATK